MTTAAKTKKKNTPAPAAQTVQLPPSPKQQVTNALETYFKLEDALHSDYLLDGADEIAIARENLWTRLEEIEVEKVESNKLATIINYIDESAENESAVLSMIEHDTIVEYMRDKLDKFDRADLVQAIKGEYPCCVFLESMTQREKLEEFLRTEIWPADNQYTANVIL